MSYTKHNFKDRDILTAQQMNDIDNGIYDNDSSIKELNNTVGELKEDLSETDSRLSESIVEISDELKEAEDGLFVNVRKPRLANRNAWRLQANGTVTGTGMACSINIYPVSSGEKIYLKLGAVNNSATYQFQTTYDFVTSDTSTIVGETVTSEVDGNVIVPDNAKYICICQMNDFAYEISKVQSTAKAIEENFTLEIGVASEFTTINDALNYLAKIKRDKNVKCTLYLRSNYDMREQIVVDGMDFGWVDITSENAYIAVSQQYITEVTCHVPAHSPYEAVNLKGLFTGLNGATLPNICCLFKINNVTDAVGIICYNQSKVYIKDGCGVHYGWVNLYLIEQGFANAMGAILNHALLNGISCFRTSSVIFGGGDASYCNGDGIYVDSNSDGELSGANFSYSGENGIEIGVASRVNIQRAKATNCKIGVYAYNGGVAYGREIVATTCTQNAINCRAGSVVNCPSSDLRYARSRAVYVQNGGDVTINGSNCSECSGGVGVEATGSSVLRMNNTNAQRGTNPSSNDIVCSFSSLVLANGATGGTNQTANEITSHGLIIK